MRVKYLKSVIAFYFLYAMTVLGDCSLIAQEDKNIEFGVKIRPTVVISYYGASSTEEETLNSYFGISTMKKQMVFLGGFGYNRYSGTDKDVSDGYTHSTSTEKYSYSYLTFYLGTKYYLFIPSEKNICPYLYANIFKTFASFSEEQDPDNRSATEKREDKLDLKEDEESGEPIGFSIAIGAEHFFSKKFSLGAEYGFIYSYISYEDKVYYWGIYESDPPLKDTHSSIINYLALSINFHF